MQTQAAQPVRDVLEERGVGGVLWGLGAAAATARRAAAIDFVAQEAAVVRVEAAAEAELAEVQGAHAIVHQALVGVVGGEEAVGLGRGEVANASHAALHGDAGGGGARAATVHGGELLSLEGRSLLGRQHLAQLVGHEDVVAHGREAGRHGTVSSSVAVRRARAAVLADVVQLNAVVDGRESGELHGSGVGDHVSLIGLLTKVGDHGGAQLRGPASTRVSRGQQRHVGVGLEGAEGRGLHVAAVLLEGEAGGTQTSRRRGSGELAHGRLLLLLLGLLGLLLARRLGALGGLSIVPGRGGGILLAVLVGGGDGGGQHGAAVADNGAVAVGGRRDTYGLGEL